MLIRRALMTLAVFYLLGGAASCWVDYEGVIPCDPLKYTHKDFEVYNLDNRGAEAIVTHETVVNKHAFGIRLVMDRDEIVSSRFKNIFPIFSTPLYASDCIPNGYVAQDSISSIKIFTIADFDDEHAAGSDVSEYFSISSTSTFSVLSEYVNMHGSDHLYIDQLDGKLDMLLMTPPTDSGAHQFTVEITLSDERVIEQTTNAIDLLE